MASKRRSSGPKGREAENLCARPRPPVYVPVADPDPSPAEPLSPLEKLLAERLAAAPAGSIQEVSGVDGAWLRSWIKLLIRDATPTAGELGADPVRNTKPTAGDLALSGGPAADPDHAKTRRAEAVKKLHAFDRIVVQELGAEHRDPVLAAFQQELMGAVWASADPLAAFQEIWAPAARPGGPKKPADRDLDIATDVFLLTHRTACRQQGKRPLSQEAAWCAVGQALDPKLGQDAVKKICQRHKRKPKLWTRVRAQAHFVLRNKGLPG
jgi:hypothetical protein